MHEIISDIWLFFGLVFTILEAYMFAGIVAVTVGSCERFKKQPIPWPAFKCQFFDQP